MYEKTVAKDIGYHRILATTVAASMINVLHPKEQ